MKVKQIIDRRDQTQDIELANGIWIKTHADGTATDEKGNTWTETEKGWEKL
jgi:hypothetical protein